MKTTNRNTNFDLRSYRKIEDIIFLDEPILSHLEKNGRNYFLYLVDSTESSDLYLMFLIDEDELTEYLTGNLSLRDIILQTSTCFQIEQDFNGNVINTDALDSENINEDFLPNSDSYINYSPTEDSYYYELLRDYESQSYLNKLRESAFYIKLSSNNSKYDKTLGLKELTNNLLQNISQSYSHFLKADFELNFKDKITDLNKIDKVYKSLLSYLDFRLVDLKFGSFEIGLSTDKVMKSEIDDKEIKNWALEVGNKYKDIVLDEDYDRNTVQEIVETYKEEDRRKIFNPIFKIVEDPNFNLHIKDSKKEKFTIIKIKDKSVIDRIVPPVSYKIEDPVKDLGIVSVTTIVDKNKPIKTIKLENSLFNQSTETIVTVTNADFAKYQFDLDIPINLRVNISSNPQGIQFLTYYEGESFEYLSHSENIEDGIKSIIYKVYEYITNQS